MRYIHKQMNRCLPSQYLLTLQQRYRMHGRMKMYGSVSLGVSCPFATTTTTTKISVSCKHVVVSEVFHRFVSSSTKKRGEAEGAEGSGAGGKRLHEEGKFIQILFSFSDGNQYIYNGSPNTR